MCLYPSEGERVAAGGVVLEVTLRYHHVSSASRAQARPEEAAHTPAPSAARCLRWKQLDTVRCGLCSLNPAYCTRRSLVQR